MSADSHKERAISFLTLASSGRVSEACQRHIGPGFRHHNPYFKGDAESLKAGMEQNAARFPNKRFDVQRALEDGDLVAVHSRVRLESGQPGVAVVHVFRFQNERIVELWDVGQPVPADSPNENGMF